MQLLAMISVLLVAFSIGGHATATARSADHPIVKVIALLKDLTAKVKLEGQTEEVAFQKFVYWCQTSTSELVDAIAEEKDTIDTLQSTIDSKSKETVLLGEDISKLEDEITELQASDKSASDDATERNSLYMKKEQSLKDTIKAIEDAMKALSDAAKTTDSKLLLSQHRLAQNRVRDTLALVATVANEDEQSSLMSFVESQADPGDKDAHVKKYAFKSNSVTELLKNLKLKFEDELVQATKEETNAANAHALSKSARDATITATKKAKEQKTTDQSDADSALSAAKGSLKDQQDDLTADSASLQATKTSCSVKKSEWQDRSALRKQELEAMAVAVKIMSKVSGVRTEAPSNPVPPTAPVTLIEVSSAQVAADPKARVVQLLHATAKTYHSKALERLAMEVSAHAPKQFQDIINQIQKMIFRLKQEQTDEDNHKAWCDLEISKTESSKTDKTDKSEELEAKIKEAKANSVTLTSEITAAEKLMADIKKFQAEATEIRNAGKQQNKLAIKDAVEAQKAITNAMAVLTSFYKESGAIKKESWELLQEPVTLPKDPATWDSPSYTGVNDPSKAGTGVVAVLTAISADFSKMEADTRAQEVTDAKEYEDTMKKHAIELARRSKESEMKSAQKKRLLDKVTALTGHKKHVSDELESTNQYLKDLEPACISGDSTYTERKAARDAEIKALGEAQTTLDNAFAAPKSFLQISRRA